VPITWELTSLKVGERRGLLRMLLRLPEKAVLALVYRPEFHRNLPPRFYGG